jgi:hypothetical protein
MKKLLPTSTAGSLPNRLGLQNLKSFGRLGNLKMKA